MSCTEEHWRSWSDSAKCTFTLTFYVRIWEDVDFFRHWTWYVGKTRNYSGNYLEYSYTLIGSLNQTNLPYICKVFGQTGLSKQCLPRSPRGRMTVYIERKIWQWAFSYKDVRVLMFVGITCGLRIIDQAGTWRLYNAASTWCNVMTSHRRWFELS